MSVQQVKEVKAYVRDRLQRLSRMPEHPQRAALANLRRGVGRAPGEIPELWGAFLQDFPEEMQSRDGIPTPSEWAVYLALTFYAMHQRGSSVASENMNREGNGFRFGQAVRRLVPPEQEPWESSVLKRFNALATATHAPERSEHLRGMIQLLRAKGIPLDYPQLAADLYLLQTGAAQQVRLRWGQDFYRAPVTQEAENERGRDIK